MTTHSGMSHDNRAFTFGIVAAEFSGDLLGAQLIDDLQVRYPNARFVGIGGEAMRARAGFTCLHDMSEITAIGVTQILAIYFRARRVFKRLVRAFEHQHKIDCFIAIDAPLFNVPLARIFKRQGIPTVAYVSPTYWALMPKRIFWVMNAFSTVLCLYPFEVADYKRHDFLAYYVGHPVLQNAQLRLSKSQARAELGIDLPNDTRLLCCFLGSRAREIRNHTRHLVRLLMRLRADATHKWHFVFALPENMQALFDEKHKDQLVADDVSITYGMGATCLSACDIALLKSGTSTLEATVAEKPMVIYYYASWMTRLPFYLVGGRYFGMPNFLCSTPSVPELHSPSTKQFMNALYKLLDQEVLHKQQQALRAAHLTMRQQITLPVDAIAETLHNHDQSQL